MNTDRQNFKHEYTKYWNRYTNEQLANELYADTLRVGPDIDGGYTNRSFYVNTASELLNDIRDDFNQIDSLYPQSEFDELTIQKLPLGLKKFFTDEQIPRNYQ